LAHVIYDEVCASIAYDAVPEKVSVLLSSTPDHATYDDVIALNAQEDVAGNPITYDALSACEAVTAQLDVK
jgi:hypothetical protein